MGLDPTKPGVTVREDDIVYGYGNASGNEEDESQQGGWRDDLRVVRRRKRGHLFGYGGLSLVGGSSGLIRPSGYGVRGRSQGFERCGAWKKKVYGATAFDGVRVRGSQISKATPLVVSANLSWLSSFRLRYAAPSAAVSLSVPQEPQAASAPDEGLAGRLKKLKELKDTRIITDEEYQAKRKKLVDSI